MQIILKARQPFSFLSVVRSHGWVQLAPFHLDEAKNILHYTTRLTNSRVVALRICETQGGVHAEADSQLNTAEQGEVADQLRWILALDQDLSAFYEAVKHEPRLTQVQARAQGRILRSATLFEDVIKTVLTTNTLWAATRRMNNNLIEQFGTPLADDSDRRAFPTPQDLADTSEEILRRETRLGYRAPYVLDIARTVASGTIDLEVLKTADLPTPELRKRLLALKGVGGYAAANLLMILGRSDYLPVDSWAKKLVSDEWYGGEPVSAQQVEAAFEDWGQWKGMAYWFWDWKYLQQAQEHSNEAN